ncbi:MAG: hypothetical protein JWR80_9556 [Bradyrhizobium sp.]|nr:hypothetical protein [Bradyrhizobium sp.]
MAWQVLTGDYMSSYFASKFMGAALALAAVVTLAAPASATETTFASFSPQGAGANIKLVNAGNAAGRLNDGTLTAATVSQQVKFSFLQDYISDFVNDAVANYTLNATIAKGTAATSTFIPGFGTFLVQTGISGKITFLSTSAISVTGPHFVPTTYAAGSNLLTVTFTNAALSGLVGSSNPAFGGGTLSGGSVAYSSDFLDFSNVSTSSFSYTLGSVTPGIAAATGANKSLKSFSGASSALFSSDPVPQVNGAVPEPATWMMMIFGFLAVGVGLRVRRINRVLTAA